MGTFPDSLGMTSYTLAILLLALKPIVKKFFSLEIVIFHTLLFYLKQNAYQLTNIKLIVKLYQVL
jgi:hypothetical protein